MPESTKDRLLRALRLAAAPERMIARAAAGDYDDYETQFAFPKAELVQDSNRSGLYDISRRTMDGEFDATEEEGNAWFAKEGRFLME